MDLLRQPDAARDAPEITRLLTVERDGNPLRRHGHVSPHIGKVAPLDAGALSRIARLAAASLPHSPGPTLVIGMTESALLLAWFLAARLGKDAELRFTTREQRSTPEGGRTFIEPHSHGPVHSLSLPEGSLYGRVVVVEDELTSGATLQNLLLAIGDVPARRHHVVTLADLRSPSRKERLREETGRLGMQLSVLDLSRIPEPEEEAPPPRDDPPVSPCNPHGRPPAVLAGAVDAMVGAYRSRRPGAVYVIGECVDVAMAARGALLPKEGPSLRHVTRSPWLVDGDAVRSRLVLSAPPAPRYFLYNWEEDLPRHALVVGEESARPVARRLGHLLVSRGVEVQKIEVPRA